ncbi:copper amine oxidase N-terminal domain-containing protein [Paenibacillus filicis]|uniref:Copper amine oxidase N-terminal domain-containing protein n=2 Tax=Paenibacillus filicis TaxID=669464 RepID=A0ABU9DW97_9BACL
MKGSTSMRRKASLLLLASLILSYLNTPMARAEAPAVHEVVLTLNDTTAQSKGAIVQLSSAPYLMNDTTMVPLRFVSEALGAEIQWNEATRTALLTYGTQSIQLTIDFNEAIYNGKSVHLDQPAVIVKESTMAPLRFIAECFDYKVSFDSATRAITLSPQKIQPGQAEVAKPKRLTKITVDNLTTDPEINTPKPYPSIVSSIAADRNGRIYLLENNSSLGYVFKEYDPTKGKTPRILSQVNGNGSYNFEYQDIPEYDIRSAPSDVRKRTFHYLDFIPEELKYNFATDSLYVLGSQVVYKLAPEIHMVTHWKTFTTPTLDKNKRIPKNDHSFFFDTADGETFYMGSAFNIYATQKSGGSRYVAKSTKEDTRLVSTVKDGIIYVYDQETGDISTVTDQGYTIVARAHIDHIVNMTSANGVFYAVDSNKVYRIDTKGQIQVHVSFDELYYNRGLYDPKTGRYEQIFVQPNNQDLRFNKDAPEQINESFQKTQVEPRAIEIKEHTLLTVDAKENIILFDGQNQMLRRIHIYE